MPELSKLEWMGSSVSASSQVISFLEALHMVEKGCLTYLAYVRDTTTETPAIDSVPVVQEFSDEFPFDLPRMPPDRNIDFSINLDAGTHPISIPPYCMASKELKEQLEELLAKGFVKPNSPDMLLVDSVFDGKGYGGWRRGILIALSAKNKVGFIDGSFAQPKISSDTFKSWSKYKEMVISCCGGKTKSFKSQQYGRLIQFLMGLNYAYSAARSSLVMLSPLPSINHAYSLLIRDEKQREVHITQHPGEGAFLAAKQFGVQRFSSEKRNYSDEKKSAQFCNYCKKQNHTIETCYRLKGFSADFKFTKPRKFSLGAKSNVVLPAEENGFQSENSGEKPMTQDQYHSLYQLLQYVKIGNQGEQVPEDTVSANYAGIYPSAYPSKSYISVFVNSISWILDSGASEHMTSNLCLLFNVKDMPKPIYVGLPNSHRVLVFQSGCVTLLPNFILQNVLFVLCFNYNLLSVHKLCVQFRSILMFSSLGATLHAPSMKRPVVLGKHTSTRFTNYVFSSSYAPSNVALWHYRLGHLPLSNMKNISSILSFDLPLDIPHCDICAKARQTKLPFHSSSITSKHIFDLIHVDTWGPYKTPTHDSFKYFLTIVDDFSRETWTFLLSTKSNAFLVLKHFLAMTDRQFHTKVKAIRTDNALELGSTPQHSEFFASQGIEHQTGCDLSSSSIPISVPLKSSSISSPSSPQYSHITLIPSHFFSSPHAVTSSPIPFPDYSTSPDCMLPHPSPSVSPLSPSPAQPTLRRSLRDHHVPSYLNDYVCNLVHLTNVSSSCFSSSVSPTVLSFSALSHSNQSLLNSVSHISEPTTYFQASLHSGWQEAMSKELQALESNNTWEVV
ncbi:uncharacterized protein [Nicotiana tomentosiformis]|uniref:uncharacterized protein n=1 Tax=Nicotiana tomentosiformis TaxID=4098 RepID=UPI00388C5522